MAKEEKKLEIPTIKKIVECLKCGAKMEVYSSHIALLVTFKILDEFNLYHFLPLAVPLLKEHRQ